MPIVQVMHTYVLMFGLISQGQDFVIVPKYQKQLEGLEQKLINLWTLGKRLPSTASFTKEVNSRLAKCPLVFNGRLTYGGLTSLVKEANSLQLSPLITWLNIIWYCVKQNSDGCRNWISLWFAKKHYTSHQNKGAVVWLLRVIWRRWPCCNCIVIDQSNLKKISGQLWIWLKFDNNCFTYFTYPISIINN